MQRRSSRLVLMVACIVAGLLATIAAQSAKAGSDQKACRFANDVELNDADCEAMRRFKEAEDAQRAGDAAALRRINDQYDAELKIRQEQLAREKPQPQEREKWATVQAEQYARQLAEQRRRQAIEDAQDRADEQRASKAAAAAKAKCGADYKAPRIGMPITRAQECVTSMRVTAQLNRADGVVTTYQGGGAYFHVMNGLIVSWGR